MFQYKKVFVWVLLFASPEMYGQTVSAFKSFDMKSALINYEITGSGTLSPDSNLSIEGRATLVFTEWGARKLFTEKYVASTTGAVKNTNTIRTLNREDRGDVYTVDFEKEKIKTSKDSVLKKAIATGKDLYQEKMQEIEEKGKKVGDSAVLGFRCTEWLYEGKKRCYYKGIPLKEESMVSGIGVVKTAISAEFDKNISEDAFALPDFDHKKRKGFLMDTTKDVIVQKQPTGDSFDDDNTDKAGDASQIEEATIIENSDLTENVFELQKALLPKLLREMQEARVCLENANDKNEANLCLSKLVDIEEEMSGEKNKEREITVWTKIVKENTMDELEDGIMDMKRRMPCIRRSRDFDDLSGCMRDSL